MRVYIQQLLDPNLRNEYKKFSKMGVHSTIFYLELIYEVRNLPRGSTFNYFSSHTENCKMYIDIFYGVSCNIRHITAISHMHFQWKSEKINIFQLPSGDGKKVYGKFAYIIAQYMEKWIFQNFHQMSPSGGYIQHLLIPTSEMNSKMFPMGGVVHLTLVSKCALGYIY